jgi:hypothetical protein
VIDSDAEVGENPAAMRTWKQDIRPERIEQRAHHPVGFRQRPPHLRRRESMVVRIEPHVE